MSTDIAIGVLVVLVFGLGTLLAYRERAHLLWRIERLERQSRPSTKTWSYQEFESYENFRFALGRYLYERKQIDGMLENAITHLDHTFQEKPCGLKK